MKISPTNKIKPFPWGKGLYTLRLPLIYQDSSCWN